MKELALRAVDDLTEKHKPEFIVLYGSVARGDFTEDSDIDIACFCKSPKVAKDVRIFEGRKLDCWIYSVAEADPNKRAYLRFVGGELYADVLGTGREFLNKVCINYEDGPEPVTPDAIAHLVEWAKHMLERSAGEGIEANYRRASLPCELLEIYFKLRNIWYLGSKNSFSWLRENDTRAYLLFEESFSDPTNLDVLARLVDVTIVGGSDVVSRDDQQ